MKGTSQNYSIPPLYDNDSNELIYDEKIKANLLNKYLCSVSFVDDTNHVHPDIPSIAQFSMLMEICLSGKKS
jgi:hypothetical protein